MILLPNRTVPLHRITFQTDLKNTVFIIQASLLLSDGRKDSLMIVPGVLGNLLAIWELPLDLYEKVIPLEYQLLLESDFAVWVSKKERLYI